SDSIQPAGIDLSLCEVLEFLEAGSLSVNSRSIPKGRPVSLQDDRWRLKPGAYRIRFCEVVKIPVDQVALCFPRSTLLRMGADLRCTVWDPGYMGRGEGLLVVYNPEGVEIQKSSRVAQLVFLKLLSHPHKLYDGAYQGENLGTDMSSMKI
ncbi:MAG: deoxyuridine 5'-triphosphate nucleotidohydrolase, partial [Acidilobaceae archaeon]